MTRKIFSTETENEARIGFARAVRTGAHVAVSGTGPHEANGDTHAPGDVYRQTKRCLELAVASVEKMGGQVTDINRTRVMLTDITRWEDAARAHGDVFAQVQPACTFVGVSAFVNPLWMVEVEVDAIVVEPYDHSLDR